MAKRVRSSPKKMITLRIDPEHADALYRQAHESHLSVNTLIAAKLGLVEGVCQVCGLISDEPLHWSSRARNLCQMCHDLGQHRGNGWRGLGERLRIRRNPAPAPEKRPEYQPPRVNYSLP